MVDAFLTYVGGVSHYGVHFFQSYTALGVPGKWYVIQVNTCLSVEEVRLGDQRIVALVTQMADGKVNGRKLGWKRANVHSEYIVQQLLVGGGCVLCDPGQLTFPVIGSYKKSTSTAGRVKDTVISIPYAERH